MRLSNSAAMRKADAAAINEYGIPSLVLMERAAHGLVEHVEKLCSRGKAAVIAGTGNNGGDGAAAAAMLLEKGWTVRTFLTGSREKLTADHAAMTGRFESLGGVLESYDPMNMEQAEFIKNADVIVDAIFGIGLNKNVEGKALEAIKAINASPARKVAADIPSGVEADTGRILGDAVRADVTVTFSAAKPGQFAEPGCTRCGRVAVWDIGIPEEVLEASYTDVHAMTDGEQTLPPREPLSHKGNYGRLLIIAGAVKYTGAPSMCSCAAVRAGAGLVYLGVPRSVYTIEAVKNTEAMVFPLPDDGEMLSRSAAGEIINRLSDCDVCVIGPGLGRSPDTVDLVKKTVASSKVPLIMDADAIYALSTDMEVLKHASCPIVLTPHEGEFARIGRLTGDRIGDAKAFAQEYGCCLVLKGHRTLAAMPGGEVYITTHGNPGMAKGGTGDVLAGILGALAGQLPLEDAVRTGVFLHSLAGDLCRDELGEYAMCAGDIINKLPMATKMLIGE